MGRSGRREEAGRTSHQPCGSSGRPGPVGRRHPPHQTAHMPFLKIAKWLPILVTVILLAGAAGARADGPAAPGDGTAAPAAVPVAPVPVVPAVPVVPSAPVAAPVPPVAVPTPPAGVTTPSTPPAPTSPTPPPVPTPPVAVPTPPTTTPPAPTAPTPPAVPTPPVAVPTPPTPDSPAPAPPAPVIPAPIPPVPTPTTPTPPASSPPEPAPTPVQAPTPQPAASNTTTQTITQVQAAPCTSHCDGGVQIQEASQDNTTVQVVDPGPAATAGGGPTAAPPQTTTAPSPTGGATQVQVGCMQYCYGATTLDTSGLTLAQIEQLLGALVLPGLPPLTLVPGTVQNVTQQASDQSQTGDGPTVDPSQTVGGGQTAGSSPTGDGGTAGQAQVAAQSNTTVQVVAGATGAGVGPAAVNQTAQGIWQVQIGCLFDCAGTQQLQQATQSNTTVQAVGGSGAADATVPSAVDTVIRIVWQLQIGCLFWCYDAVEAQRRPAPTQRCSSRPVPLPAPLVAVVGDRERDPVAAQPVAGDAPADAPPMAPGPAAPPDPTPPATPPPAAGTRAVGGAGMLGAALGLAEPRRIHPVLRGDRGERPARWRPSPGAERRLCPSARRGRSRSSTAGVPRSRSRHHERHPRAANRTHEPPAWTARPARRAAVRSSASYRAVGGAGAGARGGAGARRRSAAAVRSAMECGQDCGRSHTFDQ